MFIRSTTGLFAAPTGTSAADSIASPADVWAYTSDNMDDFEILGVAGKGAASVVYRAAVRSLSDSGGLTVALKKTVPYGDGRDDERTAREIAALRRGCHPGIVQFLGAFRAKDGESVVLLEYCELGSLKTVLRILRQGAVAEARLAGADPPRFVGVNETHARSITFDLVRALEHLHRGPDIVLHRDIKPDNVLITKSGTAKLADFGLADFRGDERRKTVVGTPWYMAPEIVAESKPGYDESVDLYAFGNTVIAMLEGEPPHWKEEPMPMLDLLRAGTVVPVLHNPQDFSSELIDFVAGCCVLDAAMRRCAAELVEHPWVNEPLRQDDGGRRLVKQVRKALVQGGTAASSKSDRQSRADAKMLFVRAAPRTDVRARFTSAFGAHRTNVRRPSPATAAASTAAAAAGAAAAASLAPTPASMSGLTESGESRSPRKKVSLVGSDIRRQTTETSLRRTSNSSVNSSSNDLPVRRMSDSLFAAPLPDVPDRRDSSSSSVADMALPSVPPGELINGNASGSEGSWTSGKAPRRRRRRKPKAFQQQ
jgi:serine/threonine protein kinase